MPPAPAVIPPVLGRPSVAAAAPVPLRPKGLVTDAAYRADAGATPWWQVRAASVAGVRHRLTGGQGEDAYGWAVAGDRLVVALADGVGSWVGAEAAALSAVASGRDNVATALVDVGTEEALHAGFSGANRTVAEGEGATTLVIAVLAPDGSIRAGRIGDSTILVVDDQGRSWEVFDDAGSGVAGSGEAGSGMAGSGVAGSGEAGSGMVRVATPREGGGLSGRDDGGMPVVTAALPRPPGALDQDIEMAEVILPAGATLVLVTDGVADPWRDGPTTVAPSLAGLLQGDPSALDLVVWADFGRHGCHDDRTIVTLRRTGSGPVEPEVSR